MALFRTLPIPINDLLPSLMVEVCLVLASDVNFFLNSREQGLPCWLPTRCCLSFFPAYIVFHFFSLSRQIYAVPDLCCIVMAMLRV